MEREIVGCFDEFFVNPMIAELSSSSSSEGEEGEDGDAVGCGAGRDAAYDGFGVSGTLRKKLSITHYDIQCL